MQSNRARILIAIAVAAATPATIFAIPELIDQLQYFQGSDVKYALQAARTVWITAFVIALAHTLILGVPLYFLLKKFNLIRWWISLLSGFIIGFLPLALFSWPYHPNNGASYRAGNGGETVDYIINGVPTAAGWTSYIYGACGAGFCGAISAFAAWLVWRGLSPKQKQLNAKDNRT